MNAVERDVRQAGSELALLFAPNNAPVPSMKFATVRGASGSNVSVEVDGATIEVPATEGCKGRTSGRCLLLTVGHRTVALAMMA